MLRPTKSIFHLHVKWIYNGYSNILQTLSPLLVVRVSSNHLDVLDIMDIKLRTTKNITIFSSAESSECVPVPI